MLVEPEGRVLFHFPTARSSRTRLLRVAIGRPATSSARPFGCWNTAKPTCGRCERHWWTANGAVDGFASTPSLPANALRSRAAGEPYICCHPPPEPTSNTSGDHTRDRCDVNQAEEYLRDSSGPSKGSQRIPGSVRPCDEIQTGYLKLAVGSHMLFYRVTAAAPTEVPDHFEASAVGTSAARHLLRPAGSRIVSDHQTNSVLPTSPPARRDASRSSISAQALALPGDLTHLTRGRPPGRHAAGVRGSPNRTRALLAETKPR